MSAADEAGVALLAANLGPSSSASGKTLGRTWNEAASDSKHADVGNEETEGDDMRQKRRRGDHSSVFKDVSTPLFRETVQREKLLSVSTGKPLKINLKAEAQGFFFIENNWTCYRRNYFKVSTGFQLLDDLGNDVNDTESFQVSLRSDSLDGVGSEEVRSDVLSFRIGITSRAIGGGPLSSRIDIVQHTTKRDRGPQRVPDMFTVRPGARLSSQIADETVANFERIQFKSSTSTPKTGNVDVQAAASSQHQQFAQISLELYAVCKNGVKHSLAVLETCPLIVRSRSPSHYEGVEMSPMQRARMACGGGSVKAAAAGLKRGAGEKGAGLQRKGALASPSPSPFVKRPTRHLDSLPAISESSLRRIAPLPKSSPFYRAAPTIATTRQSEEPTVEKEISVTPSHECVEKLALRQEAAPSNPSIKIPVSTAEPPAHPFSPMINPHSFASSSSDPASAPMYSSSMMSMQQPPSEPIVTASVSTHVAAHSPNLFENPADEEYGFLPLLMQVHAPITMGTTPLMEGAHITPGPPNLIQSIRESPPSSSISTTPAPSSSSSPFSTGISPPPPAAHLSNISHPQPSYTPHMGSINYNPFTQSSEYTMPGPVEDSRWVSNVHNASTPLMAIPSHQLISDRFVAHPSMLHHHQALHPVDTHILPQPDPPMSGDHFFVPAHSMTSSTTVPIIVDTIPHGLVSMPTFGNEQYVFTQHGNTHATPPIMVPSDLPPAAWSPYAPPPGFGQVQNVYMGNGACHPIPGSVEGSDHRQRW